MNWTHISNSGAQATSGSQTSLSATFPGTIAPGDLIVVSVAFFGPYVPTVQDSAHTTAYTYLGPTPGTTQQIGTWYYTANSGGSSFEVTVTGNGASYLAMSIDAYSFTAGDVIGIDSNGYASGTSETPTLSPALSVTTTDLVYAACIINGTAGTVSAGTGFAMRYSKPIIGGQSYGIAAEDYTNESSDITPSFSFADSTSWGLNAIAFRAAIQSVTIVGPNQGLYSTQQEFSVSLAGPAGAGGIVVSLASTNGSDTFQATSSGSSITSITIPANALSANFYLTTSSTGTRNITITAGSVSCPNSPYAYDALANATSYTVTGPTGGHQLVPVTWTIALIGGGFAGTITATPGGGTGQSQIFTPVVTTFTGNGTVSKTFSFTPLDVDSVTFTFTNSGSLTNPSPKNYISTGEYLADTFTGASVTSIQSHTSNTLQDGVAGSPYTTPSSGAISLDGSGGTYLSATGTAISLSNAAMPASLPIEIVFELNNLSSVRGATAGVVAMSGTGSNLGFWWDGSRNQLEWFQNGSYAVNGGSANGPAVGVSWLIKINIELDKSDTGYTYLYSQNSTNGGTTWASLGMGAPNPYVIQTSSVPSSVTPGLYFTGTAVTPTTGPHIANLVAQDPAPATPRCSIATSSPAGTAGAYISTSGQKAVFFFANGLSGGPSNIIPTAMNFAPSFFKNGTSIGVGINAWITGYHSCATVDLQPGIQINPGDVVTVSAPASWMSLGTTNASNGVNKLEIANYSGMSCFGTNTLTKTFKPGFNFSDEGPSDGARYNIPMNWRYKLQSTIWSSNTVDGYPTKFVNTSLVLPFFDATTSNSIDNTEYPGLSGYWAIAYDDNYQSYSGAVPTTLSIVPMTSDCVVTQDATCVSVSNPGTNGIGQFYMFNVAEATGAATVSMPIALQWTNHNRTPYISNLWIVAPGDFSYTEGTPLEFDRFSNPYALSKIFLERFANSAGTMRWLGATLGYSTWTNLSEPWEEHQLTDFSWNNANYVQDTIGFSSIRALNLSVSPYVYTEWTGSPYNMTLNTAISATATTLSINAGSDAYAIPIAGLLLLAGTEKMRIRSVAGTSNPYTVTVERGSSGTTAAAQSAGTISCLNRLSVTSLSQIGSQLIEVVTSSNHNLKTGLVSCFQNGSYPSTLYFTDGSSNSNVALYTYPALVTGPTTFVHNLRGGTGSGATLGPSTAYPAAPSSYTLNPASETYQNFLPGVGFPPEFIAKVTGSCPGCNIHVNIPAVASDSYVYDVANKIKNNFPAGRKVYLELGDEFWNYGQYQIYFADLLSKLCGYSDGFEWYVIRTGQIRTIFRTVFGNRAGEVLVMINSQWSNPNNGQDMLNLAVANDVTIDISAVGAYINPDTGTASVTAWNDSATIPQIVDLWVHDLYYNTTQFSSFLAGQQSNIGSYNSATGGTCSLYGYEGGFSAGTANNANNATTLSHDMPYDPKWLIIEQDFYALLQRSGFVDFCITDYSLYYFYNSNWGNYHWPSQPFGRGDGSDGKANNRLCLATPGFEYTKATTTNQDQQNVSVRGQAFLEWMQPAQDRKRMLFVPYRFVNR